MPTEQSGPTGPISQPDRTPFMGTGMPAPKGDYSQFRTAPKTNRSGQPIITPETLYAIAAPILATVAKKNHDYGNSVFEFGIKGIFIRLWDKLKRLRTLVWDGTTAQVTSESARDTFEDIIGYCILALAWLDAQEGG